MNFFEIFIAFLKVIKNNFPQVIGVFGTLSGTILGWFLKYLQDNIGRTEFIIEEIEYFKDSNDDYAYFLKVFVCNHSLKPRYIQNVNINFINTVDKTLNNCPKFAISKNYYNIKGNKDFSIINLKFNEPNIFYLCNILSLNEIRDIKKIDLEYKNEKGKIKKVPIVNEFSIDNVKKYPDGEVFPN